MIAHVSSIPNTMRRSITKPNILPAPYAQRQLVRATRNAKKNGDMCGPIRDAVIQMPICNKFRVSERVWRKSCTLLCELGGERGRYRWWHIVPICMVMMSNSVSNPENAYNGWRNTKCSKTVLIVIQLWTREYSLPKKSIQATHCYVIDFIVFSKDNLWMY